MAVLKLEEKEPQPGKTVRTRLWLKLESVMETVGSYLKTGGNQLVKLKDPSGKSLGTVTYHLKLPSGTIIFEKLREARSTKKLLANSLTRVDSVIIRTDTTDEGFIASEREIK